jgi:2-dehydro-3-deoxyphosphogluconate aldolase/(4S)-4-hydroxy-2-oxoglutarate aldolase
MNLHVPLIGILRGIEAETFGPLQQASFAAGLQAIEVTMNTPGAEEIIARNRGNVPGNRYLGMGTVRNLAEARRACASGAMFLVTPNVDEAVIEFAGSREIPIIARAMTPTEVYRAWDAGAFMVKVFPCRALGGPLYISELCGPFDHIPLVAVGGVNLENAHEYLRAGATALGVGIRLFGEEAVKGKNWQDVKNNVERFINSCTASWK